MNFIDKIKINNAIKCIKKGNLNKALIILSKVKSSSFDKHFYKGICYYELEKLDKAQSELHRAEEYKEDYKCIRILAEVYLQKGKWEKALNKLKFYKDKDEIRKIIKIIKDKNRREDYIKHNKLISKAMNYIRLKEYRESIECYKKALNYAEDKASVYNQIGAVYFNYLKDKERAEKYFYKAYEMVPYNKAFKMNYAKTKLRS